MLHVYFMRHGETDWNTVKRFQGSTDIPLNANGVALAKQVSKAVYESGIRFDRIYTSPLSRAQKTAELMNAWSGAEIVTDAHITEFCFGKAEGCLLSEVQTEGAFAWLRLWFTEPQSYQPRMGAESFKQFFSRLNLFLDTLREYDADPENDGKNVLVVGHGGVVRGLYHCMTGEPLSAFANVKIPNCGMNLATLTHGVFSIEYTAKVFA